MFIGATIGGWFSDRVGRKGALIVVTVWFGGLSLLNAFVWEPIGLFVARLLTGVGLSAMTVVGITYISEMFPAKRRGSYQGWTMMIGLLGVPATAYVARFCVPMAAWGWRVVFVWGSLGILIPLFAGRLEESPRWYENHGRLEEADAVLERIEKSAESEIGELPPVTNSPETASRQGGFQGVVAPAYLPRTLMLVFTWMCQSLGFFGFVAWVPAAVG